MSRSNRWRTERRTKGSAGDESALEEGATIIGQSVDRRSLSEPMLDTDDGSDVDEDLPGAYAVTRTTLEEAQPTEWDPTEQAPVNIPVAPAPELSQPRVDSPVQLEKQFDDEVSVVASSQDAPVLDAQVTANADKPKKSRMCLFIVLAFVFCCGLGGLLLALLLPKGSTSESGTSDVAPSSDADCDTSTDPFLQCQACFQTVQSSAAVQETYANLKRSGLLANLVDESVQIDSCTPINIALVWVAAEIVAADKKDIELSPISISNRFVLAYLYLVWSGQNWKEKTNWLRSNSECDWYGVRCDSEGRITSLQLSSNNLQGAVERSLGTLTSLQALVLDGNELVGSIPLEVWTLPKLRKLLG
jgi:hypothetical protein